MSKKIKKSKTKIENRDYNEIYFKSITNCQTLVSQIQQNEHDDRSKLAAIFYCVAVYKAESFNFDLEYSDVFKHTKWRSFLFHKLCLKLDILCDVVQGIGRRIDFFNTRLTNLLSNKDITNHTWNIISMDDSKFICDCDWSCLAQDKNTGETRSQFSWDYFMIPASFSDLIYYTLSPPALVSDKLSVNNFLLQPIITPRFYKIFPTYIPKSLTIIDSKEMARLSFLNMINTSLLFYHHIEYVPQKNSANRNLSKSYDPKPYTLLEINKNQINIYFQFPQKGYYILTLFCNDNSNDVYDAIYSALIICNIDNSNAHPFYGYNDVSYGLCIPVMKRFGLTAVNYLKGICRPVLSPPAILEICLNKKNPNVSVIVEVWGSSDCQPPAHHITPKKPNPKVQVNFNRCTGVSLDWLIEDEDDLPNEVTFTIRIPKLGIYAVHIFASTEKALSYHSVAQYLIDMTGLDGQTKFNMINDL